MVFYYPVSLCDESMGVPPPVPFETCQEYWDSSSQDMRELSFNVAFGLGLILAFALVGHTLVHVGFGTANERMNKRVRDATFANLVRQEVAYFDVRPVAVIASELSYDAAIIHALSGEPIRTLVMSLASVLVGLIVSFIYMWYVIGVLHTVWDEPVPCLILMMLLFALVNIRPFALVVLGVSSE
jgi:ATP-binding cassette subfamily B (MDR/TAP) protein 1